MEKHPQTQAAHDHLPPLEHEGRRPWGVGVVFFFFVSCALAATQWEHLSSLPQQLGDIPGLKALPTGTFVLVVLFAIYVASKRRQVAELRGVVRGIQEREQSPPSEGQLGKLLEVISNSQRSYRELIDSLGTIVVGISLQGTVHTLNRACTDLLGKPFAAIAGKSLEDFLSEPTRAQAEQNMARFLQTRHWAGILRIQLKHETKPRFFDCVFQPIVDDGEVVGVSIMAKDVTQARERETRFT